MRVYALCLLCFAQISMAQVNVQPNFGLELAERDSVKTEQLTRALNGFLAEALSGTYTEEYVDTNHRNRYDFFFRKLARIGNNSETTKYNPPLVLKSFTADDEVYKIVVAFTGTRNDEPFVFQVTELKVVPHEESYRFYCPFEENTEHYQSKQIGTVRYHYQSTLDPEKSEQFASFKSELCQMANVKDETIEYYCFESLDDLLKAYGFLYSARQCNFLCYDLGFTESEGDVYITGTDNANYAFGFIGEFLYYNLPNSEEMYIPFVQGMATYYGGYGLSYDSMNELKAQFREELRSNPSVDFLEEFKKGRKSSVQRHFSYYVLSAFLCEKVLKEADFETALGLAYSGSGGEAFFEKLQEAVGVNEGNFHQTIVEIIEEA